MASMVGVQCASRSNNKYAALKSLTGSSVAGATSPEKKSPATGPEQQQQHAISFARSDNSSEEDAAEAHGYLLLHLIRVLALYLYVYLSQNPFLVDDLLLTPGAEVLEQASKLEVELHAMLLAYVESEIASNQFDGLVQEKQVFFAIKKIFRHQKVKAETQCKTLVALLTTYLSLLQSPIVNCAPFSMLISTLEYLAKKNKKKDVSLPLLYPIVNAIDSLSIEQRECLDALTTLWKWVGACDPSEMILTKIVNRHHSVIIEIDDASPFEPTKQTRSHCAHLADLGACFVTTLLHHSDHIFRHDPEYFDLQTPLESDTEDDESAEEPCEPVPQVQSPPPPPPTTTKTPTLPLLNAAEVEIATPARTLESVPATVTSITSSSSAKSSSKSMRRRKKKGDEKIVHVSTVKQQLKNKEEALDGNINKELSPVNPEDESLPAVLCVTIAAAAGTIAAALCVIFN